MWIKTGAVTATLTLLATLTVGCTSTPPPPIPTNADLTRAWCGSSGDRIDLRQDGSSRVEPMSDTYLSHLLRDLRDTWTDQFIWRTYFDGRKPTSTDGTWLLSEDEHVDSRWWVRLDFGKRASASRHEQEAPDPYEFGDALLVSHDGNGFELLALNGRPDEGWSSRFTACVD
ncbi:hypothetical protein [Micromonospora chokoriensis]|uniref:hypothetical protein n=1 Tax=Micromonospora chokoriensis TaxID=356851 RepID=UPI0012FE2059|nr:hypothetical protein [Micromonospora chokoriensis]